MKLNSIKRLSSLAILAVAGLVSQAAQAVLPTAGNGDVILGFRVSPPSAPGATTNVVVNLGQVSQFTGASGVSLNVADVDADLKAAYGNNWASRTDIRWGVIGATNLFAGSNGDPASTVYASKVRPSAGTRATAWIRSNSDAQGLPTGKVATLRSGLSSSSLSTAGVIAGAVTQTGTVSGSWGSFQPGGLLSDAADSFGFYGPTIEASTTAQSLDFFKLVPTESTNVSGDYLGTFVLSSTGKLSFAAGTSESQLTTVGAISLASSNVVIANGTATGSITVTRTGGLAATSVTVTATPGTAVLTTNYAAPAATVSFGQGATSATISLTGLANLAAGPKAFTVAISAPTGAGASLGATTSATVTLAGTDVTAPVVGFTAPAAASSTTILLPAGLAFSGTLGTTVSATAGVTDIASVTIAINGHAPITATTPAPGAGGLVKTWTVASTLTSADLQVGANSVVVTATDTNGNVGTSTRNFDLTLQQLLTLPPGATISPALAAGKATVGVSYTVTASATLPITVGLEKRFFRSWTGSASFANANNPSTTFTFARDNTVTMATALSPFTAAPTGVAGTYTGVVKGSGLDDKQSNAGIIKVIVTPVTGAFTGTLNIDGVSSPIAGLLSNVDGTFSSGGATASNATATKGLCVFLDLDFTNNVVDVRLYQRRAGATIATLSGTAPQAYSTGLTANDYNIAFSVPTTPASLATDEYPHGNGYGTLKVTAAGAATLTGKLADGTVYTSSTTVTKPVSPATNNTLPVFASFTGRVGSIVGTATFSNETATDITADGIRWYRAANSSQFYPYGYAYGSDTGLTVDFDGTVQSGVTGTGTTVTIGTSTIDLTGGGFSDTGLVVNNTITKLVINATTKVISGSYLPTGATVPNLIGGIVIGKGGSNTAYGYVLTPTPLHTDGNGQGGLLTVHP